MMNLQEIVSIATLVMLAIMVVLVSYAVLAQRRPSIFAARDVEPIGGRGVLPLSSRAGRGRVPDVYVYDETEHTFRRVGIVDAQGKLVEYPQGGGDGINLVKGKLYRIVGRPQSVALRPEQIIIGENADDWNVHDIKVGNRSQFAQDGVVPGSVFSKDAKDSIVGFDTIQTAMDFSMDVSYRGPLEAAPFVCSVVGTEARYAHN